MSLFDPIEEGSDLPFDPKDIRITSAWYSIYTLIDRLKYKGIVWNQEYTQKEFKWADSKESLFIESILLGLPLPPIYIKEFFDYGAYSFSSWKIIDGLRRIWALKNFIIDGNLILNKNIGGLDFLVHLHEKSFQNLDVRLQRKILEAPILLFNIEASAPKMLDVFLHMRLNYPQEKRTNNELNLRFSSKFYKK